ncbi:replication-relaxation family protein [Shigella flexneri]|nr:replication-relaxation family protein [Shigella flexneri]
MRQRDLEILNSLDKFKALTSSQIASLHFSTNANPKISCNRVLNRLKSHKNAYIICNSDRAFQDYIYYLNPPSIKIGSQKTDHYLLIADGYITMKKYGDVTVYDVEEKIPGTSFRCDAYAEWIGAKFFIEYQNSLYSLNEIHKKLDKYYSYFKSNEWQNRFERFPNILIVGKNNMKFSADDYPDMKITCIKSFKELEPSIKAYQSRKLERIVKEAKEIKQPTRANREVSEGIKSNNGKITFKLN